MPKRQGSSRGDPCKRNSRSTRSRSRASSCWLVRTCFPSGWGNHAEKLLMPHFDSVGRATAAPLFQALKPQLAQMVYRTFGELLPIARIVMLGDQMLGL